MEIALRKARVALEKHVILLGHQGKWISDKTYICSLCRGKETIVFSSQGDYTVTDPENGKTLLGKICNGT